MVALLEVISHEMQHDLFIMNPEPMMHQVNIGYLLLILKENIQKEILHNGG
jgi:hypothetical protein